MSSDIFSLIPNYWNVHERGKDVIALTHGCQAWRKTFILCPSLWTNVNCMDPNKIRIYFEHSKGSSIHLQIGHRWDPYPSGLLSQAISQVISHATGWFKSLWIEHIMGNLVVWYTKAAGLEVSCTRICKVWASVWNCVAVAENWLWSWWLKLLRPMGLFASCTEKANHGWEGGGETNSDDEIINTIYIVDIKHS